MTQHLYQTNHYRDQPLLDMWPIAPFDTLTFLHLRPALIVVLFDKCTLWTKIEDQIDLSHIKHNKQIRVTQIKYKLNLMQYWTQPDTW